MYRFIIVAAIALLPFLSSAPIVQADIPGQDSRGINSVGLGLNGQGVAIGMVEISRPPVPGLEDPVDVNAAVNTKAVALRDLELPPQFPSSKGVGVDTETDPLAIGHSLWVAGVLISTDAVDSTGNGNAPTGVVPQASLYASAANNSGANTVVEQTRYQLSYNWVAQQGAPEGGVRAINSSYGLNENIAPIKMGAKSQLSSYVDWSASEFDLLHVVAGAEGNVAARTPQDNYNGLTVGYSVPDTNTGIFDTASTSNLQLTEMDARTHIDLIAPGIVELTGKNNTEITHPGTSFAAPYVTGTAALLHQYANTQIGANAAGWMGVEETIANPRRHEVMKAVLMNSVDKFKDVSNNGKFLGMEKTIFKKNGTDTWFDSDAYYDVVEDELDTDTPLDEEMGVGQLNAKRALQQFLPGEQEINGNFGTQITGDVPLIGWDYGTIAGPNFPINKYVLDTPLEAGNFISITLAWDREVEFANDQNMNDKYDFNDTFAEYSNIDDVLENLDLYLVPAGTNDVGDDDIAFSNSSVTSVEHIFAEIPSDGDYEIWVYRNEQFAPAQDYGIAWWYGLAPDLVPPTLSGDFDDDNDVDGADFLAWQRNTGLGSLLDCGRANMVAGLLQSCLSQGRGGC